MRHTFTMIALIVALTSHSYANPEKGRGLLPPTEEHLSYIQKHWQKIETVRPNKLGAARMKMELKNQGKQALEIPFVQFGSEEFTPTPLPNQTNHYPMILPSSIDNSRTLAFPRIGDQGSEGSCVAWATTYYQATYEVGLVNGFNNQLNQQNVLSPKWTYNMINSGLDNGSFYTDAYALLAQNGAANTSVFPYRAGDYLAWDVNPEDWLAALSNRLNTPQYIPNLNENIQNLTLVKLALNNGHILTFGTYFDSWLYKKVGSVPGGNNLHAGELAVYQMSGTQNGAHMATIVGYNDSIWIDLNGNGKIDPGEMGAFLVANSFGYSWGTGGFVWISYDAFLSTSAVTPAPVPHSRQPIAVASNSSVILATAKAPSYAPSLVLEFKLSESERNRLSIGAGVSSTSQTTPTTYFKSGALIYQGGVYDFSGKYTSGAPQTSTFCLDVTDLIPFGNRYYFTLSDYLITAKLDALSLIDVINGVVVPTTQSLPQTVTSGMTGLCYVDYTMPSTNPPTPTATTIVWPANNQTVSGVIALMVKAPQSISQVNFYVDSNIYAEDSTTPYIQLYDTTTLPNGVHQFSVTSYTGFVLSEQSSVTVTVHN